MDLAKSDIYSSNMLQYDMSQEKKTIKKALRQRKTNETLTPERLQIIEEMAYNGYTKTTVAKNVGMSLGNIQRKGTNAYEAYSVGRKRLEKKILDDLIKRSNEDQSSTATIFLAKKLKLFEEHFTTAKPKSIKEAIDRIAKIYIAVAQNELNEEKATHLVGYLEKYIKAYEVAEIEERISKLEELLNEK